MKCGEIKQINLATARNVILALEGMTICIVNFLFAFALWKTKVGKFTKVNRLFFMQSVCDFANGLRSTLFVYYFYKTEDMCKLQNARIVEKVLLVTNFIPISSIVMVVCIALCRYLDVTANQANAKIWRNLMKIVATTVSTSMTISIMLLIVIMLSAFSSPKVFQIVSIVLSMGGLASLGTVIALNILLMKFVKRHQRDSKDIIVPNARQHTLTRTIIVVNCCLILTFAPECLCRGAYMLLSAINPFLLKNRRLIRTINSWTRDVIFTSNSAINAVIYIYRDKKVR